MKTTALIGTIAGVVLVAGGIGIGASVAANGSSEAGPTPSVSITTEATPTPTVEVEASPAAMPLSATEPSADRDEETFLTFVYGRLATFPTQIPNATPEELIATGDIACARILAGESVELMSVIDGEKPSEMGGYFYDSNAIIAGAQMHLCPETLP